MKIEQLTDLLVKQANARKDGNAYLVPSEIEATLFVVFPGETLGLPKVTRVEVSDGFVIVDNMKGERYIVSAEDVRAMKVDKTENSRRDRGAGFANK